MSPTGGPRPLARVLVSDDDQAISALYAALLPDHGFEVIVAPGGHGGETLSLARRSRPDLLISDLNKPGLDGRALRNAIRADGQLAALPVLLVSAMDLANVPQPIVLSSRDDYLPKPFAFEDLVERAAALLPLGAAAHDSLAARALGRRCLGTSHPISGLPCLHATAAALPAATAAPGWAAAALRVAEPGRARRDLLTAWLGAALRALAADGLLAGQIGLDRQLALVGPAPRVAAALDQLTARFAAAARRLAAAPTLAIRRADDRAGLGLGLLELRRALR